MRAAFRVDASAQIGTGHVMRMLALGQAWMAQSGTVTFICAEISSALKNRLEQEGFSVISIAAPPGSDADLSQTKDLLLKSVLPHEAQLAVFLDGYQFDEGYQTSIRSAGIKLAVVDDYAHIPRYQADYLLNQNLSASADLYQNCNPEAVLLLGPHFAMLRKEFMPYQAWSRPVREMADRVLLTLGGADPDNATLGILNQLADYAIHIKVVVGGSSPHLSKIKEACYSWEKRRAKIDLIHDASDMPALMAWADVAVAAGGSTSWELAYMGLPSIVITLAENQVQISRSLHEHGLAVSAGWYREASPDFKMRFEALINNPGIREKMSKVGRKTVDGNGAARVLQRVGGTGNG